MCNHFASLFLFCPSPVMEFYMSEKGIVFIIYYDFFFLFHQLLKQFPLSSS